MSIIVAGNTYKDKYMQEFNTNFSIDGMKMNELCVNETSDHLQIQQGKHLINRTVASINKT